MAKRSKTEDAGAFYMLMPTEEAQGEFWTTWRFKKWLVQWNALLGVASATHGSKTRIAVIDAFSKLRNTTIELYNTCDEFGLQSIGKQIVNLTDEMNDTVSQYINNPSTKTLNQIWIVANNKTDELSDLFTKVYAQWD